MKKLIVFAIAATMSLAACAPRHRVPSEAVRTLCEYIVSTYPQATLQDVYKTCYQDYFGAEHLMQDTAAARKYLRSELNGLADEGVSGLGMPMREPTGFRHRFERINLALVLNGEMPEDELLRLFIDAAGNYESGIRSQESGLSWADEWTEIERIALEERPAWKNEELQKVLREAATNNHAVRHSESFRNTYKPHYRIIRL